MTNDGQKTLSGIDGFEKRKYEFAQEIGLCTRHQKAEQNTLDGEGPQKALSKEGNSSSIEASSKGK
ncbi:MAG: hypothetical protein ACYC2T_03420 [Bacillota bacterium]